jgi:hypothetical protein
VSRTMMMPRRRTLAGSLTRPPMPLGRTRSPFSEPRLMALERLFTLAAEDMSSLYLSARNLDRESANRSRAMQQCMNVDGRETTHFLMVGRETPARASVERRDVRCRKRQFGAFASRGSSRGVRRMHACWEVVRGWMHTCAQFGEDWIKGKWVQVDGSL